MKPLTIAAAAALTLWVGAAPVHAATIDVQPGQPVQAAVDQAQPGDVVRLAPGRHTGPIHTVQPGVTIEIPADAALVSDGHPADPGDIDGQAPDTPAAPQAVGRRSGLPFDSGVFAHDAVDQAGELGRVADYEKVTGRPVDVWQIAPQRDNGIDALIAETNRIAALIPEDVQVDWATPLMTRQQAARLGEAMCQATPDPYFRPGWEFNLYGSWPWTTDRIGEDAFIQGFRDTIDGARSTCPGLRATWNPNSAQGGVERAVKAWPGDEYVDIVGLDVYDWSYEDPVTVNGGLDDWAEFTRSKGLKMSLPEWGVHGVQGRGDNPQFVRDVLAWFERNRDIVVAMSYFDEDAEYIANSTATGQMPKTGEALRDGFAALAAREVSKDEAAPAPAAQPGWPVFPGLGWGR